jgi:sterol desaturase/sphingolipid hydroxylase (fatty acid hydroxylase superfamily)
MQSFREQLLILVGTPLYMIIIAGEIILSNLHHRRAYTFKDTLASVYLLLANSSIDLLFRTIYVGALLYFYNRNIYAIRNTAVYWLLLLVLEDFLYYWLHRFDHEIRLFWAVHVTHHSSEKMNFAVGFRSSVFQPMYRFIYFIPLALLGFKPVDIIFIYSATQIWGIFVHTELINKMGWLEYIFVTPSHHRVHHASNPKYLDRNMGMFLIIWDKMFGTFQQELTVQQYTPIRYGLTKPLQSSNPAIVIFHEWTLIAKDLARTDITWKQKLAYVFGPPGWSHDGSRSTSAEMRYDELRDKIQSANKDYLLPVADIATYPDNAQHTTAKVFS